METLVGSTLGGYTLTRVLGSGGMGTVYLAEDPTVEQQVAIKVVHTEEVEDSDMSGGQALERFKQEARAVARLDHLHILPLYRYGEEETVNGPRAYMVMQYRPEGSLWDWLRRRAGKALGDASTQTSRRSGALPPGLPTNWPLGIEEANEYLRQAASALQYAHDRGIIHRDVKPANFLLRFDKPQGNDGMSAFLLLSDFGLAKFFSATSSTSRILGTPIYMAPEQFDGVAGPESDQYALAVMIYYLLAGRPPFLGEPIRLMNQHLSSEPPPIRTFAPTVSAGVEAVLTRALAKKPSARYPSVAAFADDFTQRLHKQQPAAARPFARPLRLSLPAQPHQPQSSPNYNNGAPTQLEQVSVEQLPTAYNNNFPSALPQVTPAVPTIAQPTPSNPGDDLATIPYTPASFAPNVGNASSPSSPSMQGPVRQSMLNQPSIPRGPISRGPINPRNQHSNRRRVLTWMIGGIAVLGLAAGTGIYFADHSTAAQTPSQAQSPSPTHQPGPTSTGRARVEIKHTLSGHKDQVTRLSWSPRGLSLASSSLDNTVKLWDATTWQNTVTYTAHSQGVLTVAWGPHGTMLASAGKDDTVQVWDPTGKQTQTFHQKAPITGLAWSGNESALFASIPGDVIHELLLSKNLDRPLGKQAGKYALAMAPDGRYLAVGTDTGAVVVYEMAALNLLNPLPLFKQVVDSSTVHALAWDPASKILAAGTMNGMVQTLDIATKSVIHSSNYTGQINDLAWHPGYIDRLAIATTNGLHLWNTGNKSLLPNRIHQSSVTAVAWSGNGLASCGADATINIWNI